MNLKNLSNKMTSQFGLKMLTAKKHSPTIMFVSGTVGVVATVVLASRATLKLEAVLDEAQENLNKAEHVLATAPDKYSEEDFQKDRALTYAKAAVNVMKLYGPAIIVGAASIGLLTGSHVTLNRRNAGLTAAYVAVDKAFKEYRGRVIEEVGADKDKEYRFGTETKEVYSETKEGEPIVEQVKVIKKNPNMYAVFFDPSNPNWNPTPEYNLFFLRAQQNYMNDLLQKRGFVMLNDVYDALGMDRTKAGTIVGWKLNGKGDDFIDFGLAQDDAMGRLHDFMTGREDCLLLDFNVDGTIYDDL